MEERDKIIWILENYGRAKSRSINLKAAANNIEYSLQAKVAVGTGEQGRNDTEQENYLVNKEELEEEANALAWNVKAIDRCVSSLVEKQEGVIRAKYFKGATDSVAGQRLTPAVEARTVRNIKERAINNLADRYLDCIFESLQKLLDKH